LSAPAGARRTLVVAQDFPWPATIGSHLRLAQVIEAAGELGEVDLFCLVPARRSDPCVAPRSSRLRRVENVVRPLPRNSVIRRVTWAVASSEPLAVSQGRSRSFASLLRKWADGPYDAVWFSKASTYELCGRPDLGPTLVDLDDLEDQKILGRLELTTGAPKVRAAPSRNRSFRAVVARRQALLDARRWHDLETSVARSVDGVVLCSEVDAARFGEPNAHVVPNGYHRPDEPLGRIEVGENPTALFAGSTRYGPNADGAHWLVSEVWPLVSSHRPDARLRLVGEPGSSVTRLTDPPSVTVVGRVPEMGPELARADVVVVPVRYGSGTRIKILEAFAHRIPVVSTPLGAEGLDAKDGVHLLLADDPAAFAEACVELFEDTSLRERLVTEAEALFSERFRWSGVRSRIGGLLSDVAAHHDSARTS
jgi:glycosyltransferase involved in cell wall biosynthesis